MKEKTLFLEKQIECPVCRFGSTYKYPDPDLFEYYQEPETLHKISYRWHDPYFNHYNPFYYHFWNCKRCSYTNTFRIIHEDKLHSEKNLQLAENFSKLKYNESKALKLLTYGLKKTDDDYIKALLQHYLYIFVIENSEDVNTESINIAFSYLRLATLYDENEEINKDINYRKVQDYYHFFSGSYLSFYDENAQRFNDFSTSNYKFSSESKDIFQEIRKEYFSVQTDLEKIKSIHLSLREKMDSLLKNNKNNNIFTNNFLEFSSFYDFLNKIKSRWFKIPLNTEHLIATGCSYLIKAVTSEQLKKNISYYINLIEIIVASYLKINEVIKVIKTYELGIKSLKTYLVALSEKAREMKDSQMNHERLSSIMEKIIEVKAKNEEFIKNRMEYISKYKEEQTKLAIDLISNFEYDNEEQLYRHLERNKIHKEIIEQYVRLKPKQKNRFSFTFFKPN
jgi:hypothetical protein